jgi:tetratricopeptide (TPR) repeat protein
MPEELKQPLHIADHWIRVHGGTGIARTPQPPAWKSKVEPKHLYLRVIATNDKAKSASLRQQLAAGASFFEVAQANSTDQRTSADGGFLGDLTRDQLDARWASTALKLRPGELSTVVDAGDTYFILQRLSRNFREQAEARFEHAMQMRKAGQKQQSIAELFEALKIYPRLLRALTYLGVSYGEAGDAKTGASILTLATQLYPQDAGAHFNLGIALGAMSDERELAEYRRALEIDPDLVTAYLNMGAAYYAKGQYVEAIKTYRDGIRVNPLIASLHYSLSAALQQQGNNQEAAKELELATKIDPNVAKR